MPHHRFDQAYDLDAQLREAAAGDDAAIASVYRTSIDELVAFVRRRSAHDAELIADTAFMRTIRKVPELDEPTTPVFRAYLFRTARNLMIDEARREGRRPKLADATPKVLTQEQDPAPSPEAQVVDDALVKELLDQLTDAQRKVIEYRFLDDLSLEETASRTGMSITGVKGMQRRALLSMRAAMLAAAIIVLAVLGWRSVTRDIEEVPVISPPPAEVDAGETENSAPVHVPSDEISDSGGEVGDRTVTTGDPVAGAAPVATGVRGATGAHAVQAQPGDESQAPVDQEIDEPPALDEQAGTRGDLGEVIEAPTGTVASGGGELADGDLGDGAETRSGPESDDETETSDADDQADDGEPTEFGQSTVDDPTGGDEPQGPSLAASGFDGPEVPAGFEIGRDAYNTFLEDLCRGLEELLGMINICSNELPGASASGANTDGTDLIRDIETAVDEAVDELLAAVPTTRPFPTRAPLPVVPTVPVRPPVPLPAGVAIPTAQPSPTLQPIVTVAPFPAAGPLPTALPATPVRPVPAAQPAPTVRPIPTLHPVPTLHPIPTVRPAPTLRPVPTLRPFPTLRPVPTLRPFPTLRPVPTPRPFPTRRPIPTIALPSTTARPSLPVVPGSHFVDQGDDGS